MNALGPSHTLGILGGGQLGRMLAMEAKRMGYRVIALDPEPESPCGQVADEQIVARYDDVAALRQLARRADVVTYEFENVPAAAVRRLEDEGVRVHPSSAVLATTQDRLREKTFLASLGIGVPRFSALASEEDVQHAAREIGFPAVLKTVSGGYDGRGQIVVRTREEAQAAFLRLRASGLPSEASAPSLIWEEQVSFLLEMSMIGARTERGEIVTYPLAENTHVENILETSIVPARVRPEVEERARQIVRTIGDELRIVGVYCVEMFLLPHGSVLVNEIAPRPHNSGHYTLDACLVSQFEQHVRAICGLPLAEPGLRSPVAMINLLGEGSGNRLLGLERVLADPRVRLHLYGKKEARPRRKMGHLTVLADDVHTALTLARRAREQLRWG